MLVAMEPKKFQTVDFVSDHILQLHSREQDIYEGDLLHRVTKFTHYEEKDILISQIEQHFCCKCRPGRQFIRNRDRCYGDSHHETEWMISADNAGHLKG